MSRDFTDRLEAAAAAPRVVDAPPQIPHLEVSTYGNQETFLAMLEVILNATVDCVNVLIAKEVERERREGEKKIITL